MYLLVSEVSRKVSMSFQGVRRHQFAQFPLKRLLFSEMSLIQTNVYINEVFKIADWDLEDIMYYNVIICC